MKQNKTKKRKIFMPIVMASLITVLGVGALGYANRTNAATTNPSIAPYNIAGNGHGFGAGRGQGAAGTVTAIDGSNITISSKNNKSYVVDVSGATFFKAPTLTPGIKPSAPAPITLADIKVGDTLMVRGTVTGTNVKATTVTDGIKDAAPFNKMDNGLNKNPSVGGTVSAVSGNTITLTGKDKTTYTVNTVNAKIMKNTDVVGQKPTAPTTITVSDIKVGDTLVVNGTKNGTNITATNIFDGKAMKGSSRNQKNDKKVMLKNKPTNPTKKTQ